MLPVVLSDQRSPGIGAGAPAPSDGRSTTEPIARLRVLVLDDQPAVLRALERMLRILADVTATTSAIEALRAVAHGGRFDAIVCDMRMPGLDGVHFHRAVCEIDPEQGSRVLFLTGAELDDALQSFLEDKTVLRKPASRDVLLEAIRRQACR